MKLKGFATKTSTEIFSQKHIKFNYDKLGSTNLFVSEVGFGCYRVDVRSIQNRLAMKMALLNGINLIDTSSTYTNGNAELLAGEVLEELVGSNNLSRDSIVIVTKCGYLQGQNYELSQLRKRQNKPFIDLVEYQKGLEHCIHPTFLEDQITRSLKRLKIKTIDIYLLHNPEYYLKWANNNNIDLTVARKEYYSRIKKAFEYLEKEVKKGRINHYGISSNTFPSCSEDFAFTSLEKVISIAKEISEMNHFSVIEFPMNLSEKNAYTVINQTNNTTLLELAEKTDLGVLINRPLNAMFDNKLITLAEPVINETTCLKTINKELSNLSQIEKLISEKLNLSQNKKILSELENYLFVVEELENSWTKSKNISNWQTALNQYFLPRLNYCKNYIKNNLSNDDELSIIVFNCIIEISKIFEHITSYYQNEHLKLTDKIKTNLAQSFPELDSAKNISNMAIRALRATKGINTVLVGMTQESYVEDVIDELKVPIKKGLNWNKIEFQRLI